MPIVGVKTVLIEIELRFYEFFKRNFIRLISHLSRELMSCWEAESSIDEKHKQSKFSLEKSLIILVDLSNASKPNKDKHITLQDNLNWS